MNCKKQQLFVSLVKNELLLLNSMENKLLLLFFVFSIKFKKMSTSKLKLKILKRLDHLSESNLKKFYDLLVSATESKKDISDWDSLSQNQQKGLIEAIEEIDHSEGMEHETLLNSLKKNMLKSNPLVSGYFIKRRKIKLDKIY